MKAAVVNCPSFYFDLEQLRLVSVRRRFSETEAVFCQANTSESTVREFPLRFTVEM